MGDAANAPTHGFWRFFEPENRTFPDFDLE
jgi:hypothetical protein